MWICIHGFDRGLPLKNDLSLLIFLYNVIHDNNNLTITCGLLGDISPKIYLFRMGKLKQRNNTKVGRNVIGKRLLIPQVITTGRVDFLFRTECVYL